MLIYTEIRKCCLNRDLHPPHQMWQRAPHTLPMPGRSQECGVPYIFHPIHLAEQMPDEISVCAALLHDIAEDTDITLSELESEFPSAVIDVLKLLTHKDGIDYFDYIRAIRSNPTAVRVKLADIAHNSDETRYAGCSEIDAEQLAARRKKYEKAKAILQAKNSSCHSMCVLPSTTRLIARIRER